MSSPEPLFLLSMPRSGSTLLQRMLATHPEIDSGPEPTLLLPLFALDAEEGVMTTINQQYTAQAIQDFYASTGDAEAARRSTVHAAAMAAYANASEGGRYFLDKTPKYCLIAEEILQTFPEAPVILLWRNPLAIAASIMTTWGTEGGRWNLHHFGIDLYEGLPHLIDVAQRYPERVRSIRYEDLVVDQEGGIQQMFDHLGLDAAAADVSAYAKVELPGRIQDPNVAKAGFDKVRSDRVDRWVEVMSNPRRRRWCRKYLDFLGDERLEFMGYDRQDLLDQLHAGSRSTSYLANDLYWTVAAPIYRTFELGVMKSRVRRIQARKPLHPHF
ncbi:MAG: sulfotransferase [Actinomycetota bacterium]